MPSTIQLWNNLPLETKRNESFLSFKNVLKKQSVELAKNAKVYNYGNRKENIAHCQLRNKSSNLQAHLFNQHLSDTSTCINCGHTCEDNLHFFLVCPAYINHRTLLINSIQNNLNLNNLNHEQVLHVLLFGDRQLPYKTNCSIFQAVQQFIKSTKRF